MLSAKNNSDDRRLRMVIAYDGSNFSGWQSQPNHETIQDKIEAAIARVTDKKIRIHSSGRTDAGVHALRQIAHFDVPTAPQL